MELWVLITVGAAFLQNLRSALQRQLTARLSAEGAAYVRFLFALPFVAIYLPGSNSLMNTRPIRFLVIFGMIIVPFFWPCSAEPASFGALRVSPVLAEPSVVPNIRRLACMCEPAESDREPASLHEKNRPCSDFDPCRWSSGGRAQRE